MRFLADIPDDDVRWLDRKAAEEGKSRAAIVREAIARYRAEAGSENDDWLDQAFGLWKRHGFTEDGVEYQRRLRADWDRDWDPKPGGGDG
jgi:hypothetical protein